MIPVKVDQLVLSNVGFVVLLKAKKSSRALPIVIGPAEAQAIALRLNGVETPRPLTHDLLKNLLDFLECRLLRIEVCDLKEGTFFALLVLERDGERMKMDCRPSDAIALALRFGSSIYVSERVMQEAGRQVEGEDVAESGKTYGKSGVKLSPLEALDGELKRAVKEERYEDAARLRDEITHLKNIEKGN